MRRIKLTLTGEPMSKQSVRKGKKGFYQPTKYKEREKDYILQIKKQLPRDFKMFTKRVHCIKFKVVHKPRKIDLSSKKKELFFNEGGLKEKTTKPDLMDNLKKLAYDSMSELVFKDDALVSIEKDVSKWYGLNPRIEIILEGE
jgi:Holliday junction resolvase RusA-like endonuclease